MTCQRENKIRCNEKLHIYTEYSINDIAHITYIGLTKETLKGMIINMKISELLNQEKATLSFEVFPPKKVLKHTPRRKRKKVTSKIKYRFSKGRYSSAG